MKVCTIAFGVLLACVACLADEGPLLTLLQQRDETPREVVLVEQVPVQRQKRSLLLGAGALGLGALGAGALGLGAAGIVGAGLIGAKAGFVGGALASHAFRGRSYGGGYGGYYRPSYGYGYGGGYGGYGRGYRSYYPTESYVVSDPWC